MAGREFRGAPVPIAAVPIELMLTARLADGAMLVSVAAEIAAVTAVAVEAAAVVAVAPEVVTVAP
jgi:hypothetical protein